MPKDYLNLDEFVLKFKEKGIIFNKRNKAELLRDGYYHGYKNYRFFHSYNNRLNISSYDEIHDLIKFDDKLKALFLSLLINIESAIKQSFINFVIYRKNIAKTDKFLTLIKETEVINISNLFKSNLHAFKDTELIKSLKKFNINDFTKIDIWVIFEYLSLSSFHKILLSLKDNICEEYSVYLKLSKKNKNIIKIIELLKGLRNPSAHDNVIYDLRFLKNPNDYADLKNYLSKQSGINIDFSHLIDLVFLMILCAEKFNFNLEINEFILAFIKLNEEYEGKLKLVNEHYFTTEYKKKLKKLKSNEKIFNI